MEKMNWNKLLSAKWLITMMAGLVFCYLAIMERISAEQSMTVVIMVFSAYFTQSIAKK